MPAPSRGYGAPGDPVAGLTCLSCGGSDTKPWAKARDVEYLTSDDEFAFWRCHDCGVLFISPVPADRMGEIYPPTYYSYSAPGHTLAFSIKHWLDRRFFRGILRRFTQPTLRVLDIGGGAGWELSNLRDSDPRVRETWVVDLDPAAAVIAQRNGHRYVCGPVEEFAPNEKFDLVMMLNLIEHVRDPRAVLRQVASVLAPGGLVLVKTPNFDSWDARLFRQRSWTGYHCPRHWVLFSRASFTSLAEQVGLSVKRASYTQGASFWAGSLLAWLAARGLVRISRKRPLLEHPLFGLLAIAFAAFDFLRRPFAPTSQMLFVLAARGEE